MPSRALARRAAAIIIARSEGMSDCLRISFPHSPGIQCACTSCAAKRSKQAVALRRMAELDYIIEGGDDWTSRTPVTEANRTMTPLEIKAARFTLGMNQREFAEALRVGSEAVIRSWESGRRPISGPASVAIELMLKEGR